MGAIGEMNYAGMVWPLPTHQIDPFVKGKRIIFVPEVNYTGQFASSFAAPFTSRATGASIQNLFPAPNPPKNFSAKNPANIFPYNNLTNFFNAFGTIGSSPAFYNKNRLPYAENYELSLQRQITGVDLLTVSYVGTQGHRLLGSFDINHGNPQTCNDLQAISVAASD